MSKKTIDKIIKVLPESLKNITGYIKDNFDKSGQDALSSASGTAGILIKLFAQDAIDSYFNKLSKEKLKDFGSNSYLRASLVQVGKSLENISLPNESKSIESLLLDTLKINNNTFTKENVLTIFTPQYHPIVIFVKEKIQNILHLLDVKDETIKTFTKNFNEHIESTIIDSFGVDNYAEHKKDINEFLFHEKESKLLWDMYQLQNIGFKEGEDLKYEKTFASWKPVSSVLYKEEEEERPHYRYSHESQAQEERRKVENDLEPIDDLIEEYFSNCSSTLNCLNNIAFAIADFGKGKSVFLKQYASKLAREYTETKEGYFPIYFNLRNFSKHASEVTLGVLGSYLLDEYAIRIEDEYFQKKKYIFLVDSLDESGELTRTKIDKVIASIKNIQNINKEKYRLNRIVIASRPFSDGLETHLISHCPYTKKNIEDKEIPQFISLYGFKEEQFNNWLYHTLKNDNNIINVNSIGFAKEIIESINNDTKINIYQKLLSEKTLSVTELRRPIFSYMIYQLIMNNVDFLEIGKIGVYLSFINLLTKDAKHINDKSHKINQEEEIRYRNILHSISALWMYERHNGKQGILNKADICRVLDEENKKETDREILERYENEGVTEIKFLSHSYFGEEDNNLHFQHQSFAEILLAEYYLKVFLKYGLDKKSDIDEARSKLILGEPTEQTVLFFKELIKLLKETVADNVNQNIIEKRKLLYPLLASLATEKHNTLYSSYIDLTWFSTVKKDNSLSKIPDELLKNWVITHDKLHSIIEYAVKIIDSKTTLFFSSSSTRNSLFNNELTVFQNKNISDFPTDIDKWLALVIGNLLHIDNEEKRVFFNGKLNTPNNLFNMIKNWNYSNNVSSPEWAHEYFRGIKMNNTEYINFSTLNLSNLDFSYSNLCNIRISNSSLYSVNFSNCRFNNVEMVSCSLMSAIFDNMSIATTKRNSLNIGMSTLTQYVFFPYKLVNSINNMSSDFDSGFTNHGAKKTFLSAGYGEAEVGKKNFRGILIIFKTLKGLLIFGLNNKLFDINDIKSWFDYEYDEIRSEFEELIDSLI